MKRFSIIIFIVLGLGLLDLILCGQTYYIPDTGLFVTCKKYWPDTTATHYMTSQQIQRYSNKPAVWFNFYSRSLLKSRFAHKYQKNIDWIAIGSPDEISEGYYINKKSYDVFIFKGHEIIAYHRYEVFNDISIVDDPSPFHNPIVNNDYPDDWHMPVWHICSFPVKEPYIRIENIHWLLSGNIYGTPKLQKTHLWHLFHFLC